MTLPKPRPSLWKRALRLAVLGGALVASVWYVVQRLRGIDGAAVLAGLGGLGAGQVVLALLAVATAFAAVAGQERAITAHLGLTLPPRRAGQAAAAAAAVSQTLGFGPVVGALVRRHLLREVTLGQSFAISAGITLGFFAGLGLLSLTTFALLPGPHRPLAQGALLAVLAGAAGLALSRHPVLPRPNLFILGRFLFWLTLDLAALAMALWAVLPGAAGVSYWQLLPAFLMALGLGIASGSPGGIGAFEATLLACLPQIAAADLVAGILVYRALAYLAPALCGAVFVLMRPGRAVPGDGLAPAPPVPLHDLPMAEAHLVRQGALTLKAVSGALLLSGQLAHTRVMLGRAMGQTARPLALAAAERLARAEARMLCLYKIDARMAAAARARGYAVLPIAREAVLDPAAFHLAVPERARLRRKLAHARKAGVVVQDCALPPLDEMAAVAAAWADQHGRERGFSMGRWDRTYAAGQRVITARGPDGALLAFVTFHTCHSEWALDLVRLRPAAPDGTIYAMILHAIEMARWHEVGHLSLAAVPEAGFGLTGLPARLAQRATLGAVGLAQFKSAFAPRWRPLYLAAPSRLALLIGGLEVARAIQHPAPLQRPRRSLTLLRRPVPMAASAPDHSTERAA